MTKVSKRHNLLALIIENDGDKSALFQEIGRFIFEYSRLERALRRHFRRKVGYKLDFDNIVSAGFDFSKLCKALLALTTEENGGVPDPVLQPLISKCLTINDVRIAVVHGSWFSTMAEDRVVHVSRNSMKPQTLFRKPGALDKHSGCHDQVAGRHR